VLVGRWDFETVVGNGVSGGEADMMKFAKLGSVAVACSVLVSLEGVKPQRVQIVRGFWAHKEDLLGTQELACLGDILRCILLWRLEVSWRLWRIHRGIATGAMVSLRLGDRWEMPKILVQHGVKGGIDRKILLSWKCQRSNAEQKSEAGDECKLEEASSTAHSEVAY
jgi:hypothetical protein